MRKCVLVHERVLVRKRVLVRGRVCKHAYTHDAHLAALPAATRAAAWAK